MVEDNESLYPSWAVSKVAFVQSPRSGSLYKVSGYFLGTASAFVSQVVSLGVMAELSETVPEDSFFTLVTKEALAEPPAPLNLTPVCTNFIVSPDSKAAGVASRSWSSIWFNVLDETRSVASFGVTSSTFV